MSSGVVRSSLLIDGSGAAPVADGVVIVEDGRVSYAGPSRGAPRRPDLPTLYEGAGTIVPGLIDCHVHLTFSGDDDPVGRMQAEDADQILLRAAHNARSALRAGVTTVRDCGGYGDVTFRLRRAIQAGVVPGPRLWLCGRPLTTPRGHCWYMGGEVGDEQTLLATAAEEVRRGADFVKVMASGGALTPGSNPRMRQFAADSLTHLVGQAHTAGRRVAAHAHATASIADCLAAGVDTIEHATFLSPDDGGVPVLDEEILGRLVATRTTVVATLTPIHRAAHVGAGRRSGLLQPGQVIGDFARRRMETVSQMHEAGVAFVAGSDAGVIQTPFDGVLDEIVLLTQVGLSPLEAIAAATGRAAAALGLSDRVGTLRPGLAGDVVVLDGNPLEDIEAIRHAALVVVGGQPFAA
jgi:imidazolonepropionase-like amidohydrolase